MFRHGRRRPYRRVSKLSTPSNGGVLNFDMILFGTSSDIKVAHQMVLNFDILW
jgi:hypothetical protein